MASQVTRIEIDGMTCGGCARHVRGALTRLDGVEQAEVRLAEACAIVHHDPALAPTEQLVAVVAGEGYPARHAGTPTSSRVA